MNRMAELFMSQKSPRIRTSSYLTSLGKKNKLELGIAVKLQLIFLFSVLEIKKYVSGTCL